MQDKLLNHLACPRCSGELTLRRADVADDPHESGQLECGACRAAFPVVRGIPRMVPAANYADNFGFQWNCFRKTQLDSHSGTTISRDRFLAATGWGADALRGALVLDVGCGAGRFAEIALSLGAEVVALDYSSAVDACWDNLKSHPRLHVVQANVYQLPLRRGAFDFVYCLGVLQHTPDPRRAVLALPPLLKPGGRLAIDFYLRHWKTPLNTKYWLRPLVRRVPAARLLRLVERAVPLLLPLSRRLSRVPRIGRSLSRLIPVANYEGILPLSERQLQEWAVLDTFDYFSPTYDLPQRPATVRTWLDEAGLCDVDVRKMKLLVARGERPLSRAA